MLQKIGFRMLFVMGLGVTACKPSAFAPATVVWDLRGAKNMKPAALGWVPNGPNDLELAGGDADVTLLGDKGWVFHQHCWSYGCIRRNGEIDHIYAWFARDITVDDAIPLAKEVMAHWGGGLCDPSDGGLSIDEFYDQVKRGVYYYGQCGFQAKEGGVIKISLNVEPRSLGGKRTCTLMFAPF